MGQRVRDAVGVVVFVLACCAGSLILAAVKIAAGYHPTVAVAVGGSGFAVYWAVRGIRDWRMRRRLDAEGWRPVRGAQPWPWLLLIERVDETRVHRAWTRVVDRLPVTAGEISWDHNALNGAVEGWRGRGVFVVVELPAPTEPMALRRPNRTVGTSHRLDFPEMRAAYENGEIPPWTAKDSRLFTFHAMPGRLRADDVQTAVQRTLVVVRLLDLGPD